MSTFIGEMIKKKERKKGDDLAYEFRASQLFIDNNTL